MLKPIAKCETPDDLIRLARRIEALGTILDELTHCGSPTLGSVTGQIGGILRDYAVMIRINIENLQVPLERAINFGDSGIIERLRFYLNEIKTANLEPDLNILAIDENLLELDKFLEGVVFETSNLKSEFREIRASEEKRLNAMEAEKKRAAVDTPTSSPELQENR